MGRVDYTGHRPLPLTYFLFCVTDGQKDGDNRLLRSKNQNKKSNLYYRAGALVAMDTTPI